MTGKEEVCVLQQVADVLLWTLQPQLLQNIIRFNTILQSGLYPDDSHADPPLTYEYNGS